MPGTPLCPRAFVLLLALSLSALLFGAAARAEDHNTLLLPGGPVNGRTAEEYAAGFGHAVGNDAALQGCGIVPGTSESARRTRFVRSIMRYLRHEILPIYLLPVGLMPESLQYLSLYGEACGTWEIIVEGQPGSSAQEAFERGCREGFVAGFRRCNGL